MVTMENAEEVMQILDRFTRLKQKEIPKELDEYLGYVAKTGDTVFKWSSLKYLFREKLLNVMKHFHDTTPRIDEIPQYPNVDPFNYESMKSALLERLELFNAAPFTIQRLCELLIDPRKQYNRIDKFMRALEKNILVSTVEPGRKRTESENGDSLDSVVNGDLLLDVNVDIDMEADNLFNMETQAAQNSNGTASKSEVAATTVPSPPQETEKANTSNKEPTVKVVVTHKADDDILPNPKKAKLDLTDKSQTEETIDEDDGKPKAAENNGETVKDEQKQQEEKQEKAKESENKTIEEESIKKVDTEECSKNQKEEQAIIEKNGEKLEENNCEAKVSGIEKNAIKTDSESATKTEVKDKLHNNENIIKSENKENEKVVIKEDDNKMNEQNSEDTKIKKVDKKDEKEKEKENQEEEEKQLNKTTTTTTAIQGTISEQVTMVVAESKDYETVVVEKQEIEKGEKEKLTKAAAEELDKKMENETKTVKETSTDKEESKKDNKQQQQEEQQNDSIKVVQKEQPTKTETSASTEVIEKNKMETIKEEDEDNAASHKTADTNRKTDHDNDDDDDNAQTYAVAADKQEKCSEVMKNEEKLKEQTKVESIKTTTTIAIATKEPTMVEEATTGKVEDLPQPVKSAAIVVEVEEKAVINEQALPVVIATAVTTEINMATEIENLAQAAADAAAFVKTALSDTLMILPATSLPIQDQPMAEDDVTIAEEAPPTVEEVIMAEPSSLQSEPLEATTIIPSPSLTTTNINTTTTTTTTIIDEEPSGMEVDDTSQEAMDQ